MLAWYVGALTAVVAEFLLLSATTIEGSSWHAFYALLAYLCFLSLPLQHRLMQEFHLAKATATVKTLVPSLKPYRKALLFCCSLWTCQTLPATAVMFYSSVILKSVTGNLNPFLQVALIYTGFLAGTLPMLKFGDRLPTRWVLVGTFAAMTSGLGGIAAIRLPICLAFASGSMPWHTECSQRWIIRCPISSFRPLYAQRRSARFWRCRALRWYQCPVLPHSGVISLNSRSPCLPIIVKSIYPSSSPPPASFSS